MNLVFFIHIKNNWSQTGFNFYLGSGQLLLFNCRPFLTKRCFRNLSYYILFVVLLQELPVRFIMRVFPVHQTHFSKHKSWGKITYYNIFCTERSRLIFSSSFSHWIGPEADSESLCPSVCFSFRLWQFKTPTSGCPGDFWLNGILLILSCNDIKYDYKIEFFNVFWFSKPAYRG